jgi:catechol 2,3-dioxygenase-like lactoylglutathione lyase family enzyme
MSVSHVTVYHSDDEEIERVVDFYKKLLDFREYTHLIRPGKLLDETAELSPSTSRWMSDAEGKFIVELAVHEGELSTSRSIELTFSTQDIHTVEERLVSMGVVYQSKMMDEGVTKFYFRDPAGYGVTLTNQLSPASTRSYVRSDINYDVQLAVQSRFNVADLKINEGEVHPPHKNIAILTSGGDAPGMNAAFRAVVRVALYRNCHVYAIYNGYQGMISGGDFIKRVHWNDVTGIVGKGGTIIGTARCKEFYTHEGRSEYR